MTRIRTRLSSGVGWSVLSAAAGQGSLLLLNVVIANVAGRLVFGQFTLVQSTVTTAAVLGGAALGYTANKHLAEYRVFQPERAARILGIGRFLSLVTAMLAAGTLALAAGWIARDWLGAPELRTALLIASVTTFWAVLNNFQLGALAGLEAYHLSARAAVAAGLLSLLGGTVGAQAAGLHGALVGVCLAVAVQSVTLRAFLRAEQRRQGLPPKVGDVWRERTVLTSFALPAALSGLTIVPAQWALNVLLARHPLGFAEVALFGAAMSVRSAVLYPPLLLNNVGMTLLNSARGAGEQDRFRRLFWANVGLTAGLAGGGAALIALASAPVLRVFGASFIGGQSALRVMMLALVLEAVTLSLYQLVQSRGLMWLSLLGIAIPRDLTIVLTAVVLVPRAGALGAAWALAAGHGLALIVNGGLVARFGARSGAPDGAATTTRAVAELT
jgi:O-antigen/teichoic acid export membrane protein